MYKEFFGLRKNPFVMSPDPSFLFLTPGHREALAGLTYAIRARKGFVVLTGEAGTGKTTLLSTVLQSIPSTRASFGLILNPTVTPTEFLEMTLLDFGIAEIPASKAQRLLKLQRFLLQAHQQGKVAVLIVDEAHKLQPDVLEEIRLLANFETAEGKLLQIVLAGQSELDSLLSRPDLRQLKQRIAIRLTIKPLSPQEIEQYILHRWRKAEATGELPFDSEAISRIARWSQGIPRIVNAICDNALLLAYGTGVSSISGGQILEVVTDLDLDTRNGNGATSPAAKTTAPHTAAGLRIPVPGPRPNVDSIPLRTLAAYIRPPRTSRLLRWAERVGILS